jgi:hypothetical protein
MTKTQRLGSICRGVLLAGLAITPALAVDVTYNTTGCFGVACTGVPTSAIVVGGVTITYNGVTGASVSPPYPTSAQFGTFSTTAGASGTTNTDFNLTVSQIIPVGAGAETLSDTFKGTISTSSSSVKLTFTGGAGSGGTPVSSVDPEDGAAAYQFSLGGVVYYVDQVTPVHPSTTGGGISSINGAIDASAVPEPAFYGLTGAGFAGLLLMALRRRQQLTS